MTLEEAIIEPVSKTHQGFYGLVVRRAMKKKPTEINKTWAKVDG
jgi:hypothetical protein